MQTGNKGGGVAVNPYTQASDSMQRATGTVNSALTANAGLNPANFQYGPALQAAPSSIASLMGRYTNPHETQVVQNTANQMEKARQEQMQSIGANAAASGAFGGSRHGLVEAQTNADTTTAIGDMTAQMRQRGFETAAGLAGQDVGNTMAMRAANQNAVNQAGQFNAGMRADLRQNQFNNAMTGAGALSGMAGQSFGMGNTINQNQMQSGQMAQQLMQSILGAGNDMFSQYAGQPNAALQLRLAALGMNPMNNSGTTTQTTQQPNTLAGNLLSALGGMVSFNPITLPWGAAG